MIQNTDILLLLDELKEEQGIDTSEYEIRLFTTSGIPLDILKFINDHRPLDLVMFYDKLRKSYNKKKSKLYINIVRCDEQENITAKQIVSTLTALLNQILRYDTDDTDMFYKHSRAEEINNVLSYYFKKQDLEPAYKLLKLIKADLIASEFLNGRR